MISAIECQDQVERLYHKQRVICPVCREPMSRLVKLDRHHKLRNNESNRKNYPLLIDNDLNIQIIHNHCHTGHHGSCGKMSYQEAERLETMLRGKA